MDLWMLIMNTYNFTLYSISFILESSLLFMCDSVGQWLD